MPVDTPALSPCVIQTEALVIGAGPVGLFQVFQLGLQGIHAHVVEALPQPGGQCAQLYGDKNIYDIPGITACTGADLAQQLYAQAAPFAPTYHWGQLVETLERLPEGRWLLTTNAGTTFSARYVVMACGAGAFVPRLLKLEGAAALTGQQLHYHPMQLPSCEGQHVVVLGGDEAAVLAALQCAAQQSPSVTLVHRRDVFDAPPDVLDQLAQRRAAGQLQVVIGQPAQLHINEQGALEQLSVTTPDGNTATQPADVLLAYLGISPKLGPVADWALEMQRKQLPVDTASFATSQPGIYAVGDINTYPGKRKLIVCGFHEATLAAFAIAEHMQAQPVQLQYTSSSRHLQQLLGLLGGPSA